MPAPAAAVAAAAAAAAAKTSAAAAAKKAAAEKRLYDRIWQEQGHDYSALTPGDKVCLIIDTKP